MITSSIGNSFLNTVSLLSGTRRFSLRSPETQGIEALKLPGSEDNPILPIPVEPFSDFEKDRAEISDAARAAFGDLALAADRESAEKNGSRSPAVASPTGAAVPDGGEGPDGLTPAEREQVQELRERDREVRAHEQAHLAAAGGAAAGGASYTYQLGPDGQRYAVGGEVPIQVTSGSSDPDSRIEHARRVRAAALAPADPSGADLAVAARASREIAEARADRNREQVEELSAGATGNSPGTTEEAESVNGPGTDLAASQAGAEAGSSSLLEERSRLQGELTRNSESASRASGTLLGRRLDVVA